VQEARLRLRRTDPDDILNVGAIEVRLSAPTGE
jgi:hypothetical protein